MSLETAMIPAATRGVRERTVFHTWPLVSRTFKRPAVKRVRKPRPAKEIEEWPLGKERYPSLRKVVLVQTEEVDNANTEGFAAVING